MPSHVTDPAIDTYLSWVTEEVGHRLTFAPTGPFTARASGKPTPDQGMVEFHERQFLPGYFVTAREGAADRTKMDSVKLGQALVKSMQKTGNIAFPEVCSTTAGLWVSEATLREVMANDHIDESTIAEASPTRLGQHLSAALYPERQRG